MDWGNFAVIFLQIFQQLNHFLFLFEYHAALSLLH